MFKVENDIPIPTTIALGARSRYPLGSMEVGDSFLIPADHDGFRVNAKGYRQHNVQASMSAIQKAKGIIFKSRKQEDGSIRVWRVK